MLLLCCFQSVLLGFWGTNRRLPLGSPFKKGGDLHSSKTWWFAPTVESLGQTEACYTESGNGESCGWVDCATFQCLRLKTLAKRLHRSFGVPIFPLVIALEHSKMAIWDRAAYSATLFHSMCSLSPVCESGRAGAENKANDSVIHYICNLLFVQEKREGKRTLSGLLLNKGKEIKKTKKEVDICTNLRHIWKE